MAPKKTSKKKKSDSYRTVSREKREIKSEPVKEKKEITTEVPVPDGFVATEFLQDYENHKKGEKIILVERRYKTLNNNGVVK